MWLNKLNLSNVIIMKQFILIVLLLLIITQPLNAAGRDMSIIRDAEIEEMIKEWSAPVMKAAGFAPDSVNVILVQSPQVNAFVAGGANIFFYTGLLLKTDNPSEVIGVYAHELGHISGGHLIAMRQSAQRASFESILGTVLGIGVAILTGEGQAAAAIGSAAQGYAASNYLRHSRVHESSADQAALTYLDKAHMNPRGLETFLEKLRGQEYMPEDRQSEYIRTHPLTSDRIDTVRRNAERSDYADQELPAEWIEQHARMKAKLLGFINPGRVEWDYNERDESIAAKYAHVIADYRQSHVEKALAGVDDLISREPDNPYFYELKGQMLLEFGRVAEAEEAYRHSVELKPGAALIRMAYGHALLEDGKNEQAIAELKRVLKTETRSATTQRLLATAYGRMGQEDVAKIYLAEEALLLGDYDTAMRLASRAQESLPQNSSEWLQAQDVKNFAENGRKRRN